MFNHPFDSFLFANATDLLPANKQDEIPISAAERDVRPLRLAGTVYDAPHDCDFGECLMFDV